MTASAPHDTGATLRRLRKVFSFGVLGNGLTLLTNFLIPPLFIASLGTERYGAWLYLFTIPTSLAMCDLGVSAAFSTEVYKLYAKGEREAAARIFKTGVKAIGGLMVAALLISSVIVGSRYLVHGDAELHTTVLLLCAYVLSGFMSELLSSSYKITGLYHRFQSIGLFSKLAEIGALLALIPLNDFRQMAFAMLLVRLLSTAGSTFVALRLAPELSQGSWRGWIPFRHLVVPSLMYAANPLIMFIALQVPLLIIAPTAGMTAVVTYTTVRTLTRLPLQISNQVSMSLYTEFTRLHASGQRETITSLYRKSLWLIAGMFLLYAVGGLLLGDEVYASWLKHVPPEFHFVFVVLACDAAFESLMRHRSSLSSATNQHARDTLFQLAAVSLSIAIMWISARTHATLTEIIAPGAAATLLALTWAALKTPSPRP